MRWELNLIEHKSVCKGEKLEVKKEENESNEKRGTLFVFSVIRETLRESE